MGLAAPGPSLFDSQAKSKAVFSGEASRAVSPLAATKMRPSSKAGDGIPSQIASYFHTASPVAGLWAESIRGDCRSTSDLPDSSRMALGELQLISFCRAIRHFVSPVAVSMPAANESA